MGYKPKKTSHKDTNLFDLQGREYILYEVTQNVQLVSTPFLQKAKYEKSFGTFCVLSIPTAENTLAIRRLPNKRLSGHISCFHLPSYGMMLRPFLQLKT